jgi:hypothetical protein
LAIEARKINVRGTNIFVHEVERSNGLPFGATLECEGEIFSVALISKDVLTKTRWPNHMISKAAYSSLLSTLNGIFGPTVQFDWINKTKVRRNRRR